ncbi:hypothetical protein AAZV13_01G031900 [Glycine max]
MGCINFRKKKKKDIFGKSNYKIRGRGCKSKQERCVYQRPMSSMPILIKLHLTKSKTWLPRITQIKSHKKLENYFLHLPNCFMLLFWNVKFYFGIIFLKYKKFTYQKGYFKM